jgi:hypothetical protein
MNGTDPLLSSVEVKSGLDGADITVDENCIGSTPSTPKLTAGDHMAKLEEPGFETWKKTSSVAPGVSATINRTIEREKAHRKPAGIKFRQFSN